MASVGYLEGQLNALPVEQRRVHVQVVRALGELRFGAPSEEDEPVACENFGAHLVPFTSSSTANNTNAVAHGLGRVPRLFFQVMDPNTVGSRVVGDLEVTRAADATYLYVATATTGAALLLYVE